MAFSGRERNKFFYNAGGESFTDLSYVSGLDSAQDGRVFANTDLDHDGDLDVIVISRNAPVFRVFRNDLGAQDVLALKIVGDGQKSTLDAVGARATVTCGDRTITRLVSRGSGFGTQISPTLTIGLGSCKKPDRLTIEWPSGLQREFTTAKAGLYLEVSEDGPLRGDDTYFTGTDAPAARPGDTGLWSALDVEAEHDVAYVTFWASWCESCKAAQPEVDALAKRFEERIDFMGLSLEPKDTPEVVKKYETEYHPAYPLLALPADAHQRAIDEAIELFADATPGMPAAALIDTRSGALLWHSLGVATASDVERVLSNLPAQVATVEPAKPAGKKHWGWALLAVVAFCGWLAFVNRLTPKEG